MAFIFSTSWLTVPFSSCLAAVIVACYSWCEQPRSQSLCFQNLSVVRSISIRQSTHPFSEMHTFLAPDLWIWDVLQQGGARASPGQLCGWHMTRRAAQPQPTRCSPSPEHHPAGTGSGSQLSSQSISCDPSATNKGQLAVLKIYNFFPWEEADVQTYLQSLGLLLMLYLDAEPGF